MRSSFTRIANVPSENTVHAVRGVSSGISGSPSACNDVANSARWTARYVQRARPEEIT